MDTEKNYTKEMEKLHQKQFESLPEEKQYKGGRTVDESVSYTHLFDIRQSELMKCFLRVSIS